MRLPFIVLSCALSSLVIAGGPAAPVISVHATDIKRLEFTWQSVPRTNWYELWFKANPGAQWVKYAETPAQRTLIRISASVHLLDWQQARYYVNACNPSGCTPSNEVGVDGEQLAAMGYLKPNAPSNVQHFGGHIAVSADGTTVAVVASETIGAKTSSAAVHVYHKSNSISGWWREARLVPSTVDNDTAVYDVGDQIAISADGNLIALGAWSENVTSAVGATGAVYLFHRNGTTWRETQKLTGDDSSLNQFGYVVKLDDAGQTLVVSYWNPGFTSRPNMLAIYHADSAGMFALSMTIPVPAAADDEQVCHGIALSGDGRTLMRGCFKQDRSQNYVQVFNAPDFAESTRLPGGSADGIELSFDGTEAVIQNSASAAVWKLGPNGWVADGNLGSITGFSDVLRRRIALSRDGKIAVFGDPGDYTTGVGPVFPPYVPGSNPSGAALVYERRSNGWLLRRLIKPGSTHYQRFGHVVGLGDNGRLLAVDAPLDPSAATGIDGDRDDDSMPNRGAVWLY